MLYDYLHLIETLRPQLEKEHGLAFAYLYGSAVDQQIVHDIDIGLYDESTDKHFINFDLAIAAHYAPQKAEQQGELGDPESDILEVEEVFPPIKGREPNKPTRPFKTMAKNFLRQKVSRMSDLHYLEASDGRPIVTLPLQRGGGLPNEICGITRNQHPRENRKRQQ